MRIRTARTEAYTISIKQDEEEGFVSNSLIVSYVIPVSSLEYFEKAKRVIDSVGKQKGIRHSGKDIIIVYCPTEKEPSQRIHTYCRDVGCRLVVLPQTSRFELCRAYNAGLKHAFGKYVALLSADVLLDPEATQLALAGDKTVSVVSSIRSVDGDPIEGVEFLDTVKFRDVVRTLVDNGRKVTFAGFRGFIFGAKSLFESVGGFDERYDQSWGAQDNDIVDRIVNFKASYHYRNVSKDCGVVNIHLPHKAQPVSRKNQLLYREANECVVSNPTHDSQEIQLKPVAVGERSIEPARVEQRDLIDLHPAVSIIVCLSSDKYANRLHRCLMSLRGQIGVDQRSVEIIVAVVRKPEVDGEDSPRVRRLAEQFGCRYIEREYDLPAYSFALARNFAARHARSRVLCFVDPDIVVHPTALSSALKRVSKGTFAVALAAYSDQDCPPDSYQSTNVGRFEALTNKFEIGKFGFGGFFVVPASAFETIGGYDEYFYGWGGPDNDICIRLERFGCHMERIVEKIIHQWHPHRMDAESDFTKRNRDYLKTAYDTQRNLGGRGGLQNALTVLIVHHPLRPLEVVKKTIRCLRQSTNRPMHIEVVCQGGPHPGDLGEGVTVYLEPENRGIAYVTHASITRFLEGDHSYWAKVDEAIYMQRNSLETAMKVLEIERGRGEIDVGAVQVPLREPYPSNIVISRELGPDGLPVMYTVKGGTYGRKHKRLQWSVGDYVGWGCTVFNRDVFERGCLPDLNYFMGYIDLDFCLQMKARGIRVATLQVKSCEKDHVGTYPQAYRKIRYNPTTLRESGLYLSQKWGVYFKEGVNH